MKMPKRLLGEPLTAEAIFPNGSIGPLSCTVGQTCATIFYPVKPNPREQAKRAVKIRLQQHANESSESLQVARLDQ